MTYAEKLLDPRWQRKRLEVLNAAGWKCEFCGDSKSTLHVHHLRYTGDPWDASMEDLECLCEIHHEGRTRSEFGITFAGLRSSNIAEFFAALASAQARGICKDELLKLLTKALK